MKKNIFLLSVFVLAVGCSTRKNKFVNRAYHNFTAYYNTLFHGKEALKAELKSQKTGLRDNFQEGYLEVFSQNSLIPSSEEEDVDANFFGDVISSPIQKNNIGNFQKAEEKALKAIEKHSMVFGGQQKNKEIFNAYLLLIESRIYQGKLSSALEAISQVYQTMPKDKRLPLVKIYEGLIYSKMKNNIRAEEIFYDLDKNYTLTKQQKAVMSVYQAENLLYSNRKKEAIDHLEKAFVLNKSRQTKSRIAYLRGQILAELGNMEEARESFVTAYKYSNDFELEVKSQIEIAKTFNNDKDYEEAKKYIDILNKLPKRDSLPRVMNKPVYANVYKVDSLVLVNSRIFNESYVKGKMNLKIPSLQTYAGINQMIDKLYATNNYKLINYDLVYHEGKNILKLELEEDDTRVFLKFGLHYDEIFKIGLLINTTIKRLLFQNSILSLDVIVGGNRPRYYFNYFVDNGYLPGFGIYSSGMSFQLYDHDRNEIGKWKWFRNEIYIQSIWKDRYAIGGGMSHDYFESKVGTSHYDNEKNFLNPYAFIKSDTRNDKDFASRGFYLNIEGKLLDIFNKKIEKQIFQTKADIRMNFPISSHVTYRLNLFGGLTFGKDVPYYYHFYPGGIFEQNLGNFVSFQGYQFGNFSADNIIAAGNDFQFRIKKNYFITGHINLINTFDEHKLNHVLKVCDVSGGITAGYKSPFGQIKLNYSRALDKGKGIFSVILGHWF